jgi:hypothetical protein
MMIVQPQAEASSSRMMTLLTIGSACRNRSTGERLAATVALAALTGSDITGSSSDEMI